MFTDSATFGGVAPCNEGSGVLNVDHAAYVDPSAAQAAEYDAAKTKTYGHTYTATNISYAQSTVAPEGVPTYDILMVENGWFGHTRVHYTHAGHALMLCLVWYGMLVSKMIF